MFACHKQDTREFSIPEGPATSTLKTFATQAGIEILFDSQQVGAFQTHAVSGRYRPEQTLNLMLKETALQFSIDPKTHAYAIYRTDTTLSGSH